MRASDIYDTLLVNFAECSQFTGICRYEFSFKLYYELVFYFVCWDSCEKYADALQVIVKMLYNQIKMKNANQVKCERLRVKNEDGIIIYERFPNHFIYDAFIN